MDLVRQSLAITIVFALLWLALWLLRRKGAIAISAGRSGPHPIELRGKLALSAQHSVQLIRGGGRELLVGVHPSGFTVLCDLSAPAADRSSSIS